MSVHFLSESDTPRPCPNCDGKGFLRDLPGVKPFDCKICNGSGQLGNPDAPRVNVLFWQADGGYRFIGSGDASHPGVTWSNVYPTEAAALAAARAAYRQGQ